MTEKAWISTWTGGVLAFWLVAPALVSAAPMELVLPTDNDAIFSDDPSRFYMYTDRNFEGKRSQPWSAGRFGLVRDQLRTEHGIVFTRFHEGIDIRPVRRDGNGEPLDEVRAISGGEVVFINDVPGRSNYGNYVVIRHDWGYGPFFSLYSHLRSVSVGPGQAVRGGQAVGGLGYTGAGINRERAHLHLELTMMLSERFQVWYERHFPTENHHGNLNGINLAGLDVASLFHTHRDDPQVTIPEFLAGETPYYTVAVPYQGGLEILDRYPWLGRDLEKAESARSWEITLTNHGFPLSVTPSAQERPKPTIAWVKPSRTNHSYHTLARIAGTGPVATLTASGLRYIQLLTGDF